jgi:polyferredoxin
MISGGRDTVVVVVVVTTVCWVAGPKVIEATVEFGGGMMFMVLLGGLSIGWVCGVSSVGDAGAVDRAASGVRVAGCFTCSPSPSALVALMLHESRPRMWTGVCCVRETRKS